MELTELGLNLGWWVDYMNLYGIHADVNNECIRMLCEGLGKLQSLERMELNFDQ